MGKTQYEEQYFAQFENGSLVGYYVSTRCGRKFIEFWQRQGFITIQQLLGTLMLVPGIKEQIASYGGHAPRTFKFVAREKDLPVCFIRPNGEKQCCDAFVIEEHCIDDIYNPNVLHVPRETAVIISDPQSDCNGVVYSIEGMYISRIAELIRKMGIKDHVEGLKRLKMRKDGIDTEII